MLSHILVALAAVSTSSAHFILQWPPTAGFIDDDEPNSPCGGATVTVDSTSPQVQVDQFAVSIKNTHPEGEWQFRATTSTEAPYNFTDIVPVVNTTGLGDFCLTSLSVPSSFAGQAGVIQIIDNSVDGVLYQCAPVNFVAGSNTTVGSACTNATGFNAVWTDMMSFDGSSDMASGSMTMSMASSTASATASGAAASATSSAAAAMVTGVGSVLGSLGLLAAGLAL